MSRINRARIVDYPNLWAYTREIYQMPGVAETVNLTHIKSHYYASHESPTRPFDPEWNFRLYISPIIQAPDWAKRGLFGRGCCRRCGRHGRCHH